MDQDRLGAAGGESGGDALDEQHKSRARTVRLVRRNDASETSDTSDVVVCPVCGVKNPSAAPYCGDCMSSLSTDPDAVPQFKLCPCLEDADGHRFPLHAGVNTLGRESADVLIADRSISRRHGTIVYDEERDLVSVEDLGSTNGSRINGEALAPGQPRAIQPGDRLAFGNVTLQYIPEAAVPPRPASGLDDTDRSLEPTLPTVDTSAIHDDPDEPLARLILLLGGASREVEIKQGISTVGRNPDNSICFADDHYVSGHHARIEGEGDRFLLLDVGSTNGTFLNGVRLPPNTALAMTDGDEIMLGTLLFQFHKPDDAAAQANRTLTPDEMPATSRPEPGAIPSA